MLQSVTFTAISPRLRPRLPMWWEHIIIMKRCVLDRLSVSFFLIWNIDYSTLTVEDSGIKEDKDNATTQEARPTFPASTGNTTSKPGN